VTPFLFKRRFRARVLEDCLGSVGHTELGEDAREVVAHGLVGEAEPVRDLRGACAARERLENASLAGR
jgi:hypothetical protein